MHTQALHIVREGLTYSPCSWHTLFSFFHGRNTFHFVIQQRFDWACPRSPRHRTHLSVVFHWHAALSWGASRSAASWDFIGYAPGFRPIQPHYNHFPVPEGTAQYNHCPLLLLAQSVGLLWAGSYRPLSNGQQPERLTGVPGCVPIVVLLISRCPPRWPSYLFPPVWFVTPKGIMDKQEKKEGRNCVQCAREKSHISHWHLVGIDGLVFESVSLTRTGQQGRCDVLPWQQAAGWG